MPATESVVCASTVEKRLVPGTPKACIGHSLSDPGKVIDVVFASAGA